MISDLPLLRDPLLHVPNITEVRGADAFSGLAEYMLRAVPLLGANQYLVLPHSLRAAALELLDYQRAQGVCDLDASHLLFTSARPDARFTASLLEDGETMSVLRRLPLTRLEPFIATPDVEQLAHELGLHMDMDPAVAAALNHKSHARGILEASGVPTPGGQLLCRSEGDFEQRVLRELARLFGEGHRACALTRPASFSGIGIRRVRDLAQARDALATQFRDSHDLLVEPWLPAVTRSPSFVLSLADRASDDRLLVTTDQLLQDAGDSDTLGPRHFGNVIPARGLTAPLLEHAAAALRSAGARGIVGVDMVESAGELVVTEVNARQTGAIFGALAALNVTRSAHVPACVVHNNIPVPAGCSLHDYVAHLERSGLHFSASSQQGVLVISHGNMHAGKVMVVAIGEEFAHGELVERIGLFAS